MIYYQMKICFVLTHDLLPNENMFCFQRIQHCPLFLAQGETTWTKIFENVYRRHYTVGNWNQSSAHLLSQVGWC